MSEEKELTRALPKVMRGIVVKASMEKTVTVSVESRKKHPIYKKFVRRQTKYLVHDESGECGVGDVVELMNTKPASKRKRWRISKVVQKAV